MAERSASKEVGGVAHLLGALNGVLLGLIVAVGLVSFGKYLAAMATTSLWTDELWSILHYSGRGPWTVVTEYHEPNNHIFFNLLNALSPWRGSVEPLPARIWSFAAVASLLAGFLSYFARRRAFLCGAAAFLVFATGPEFLDLTLQARGYGLLSLFALVASVLVVSHIRNGTPRTLALLGVISVLGTFTLPTFGFFIVPMWGFLWLAIRRLRVLYAALLTGAGILVVYLPVASQLLSQLAHFDERWGRQYASLGAVKETVVMYLLHPAVVGVALGKRELLVLAAGLLVLLGLAWRRDPVEAKGISVILGSALAFFAICRTLQTPLVRSTAFVVVPIAFAAALAASVLELPGGARLRRVAALAAAGFLLFRGVSAVRSFAFTPFERWKELATIVGETFPEGTPSFVTSEPDYLKGYLAPGNRLAERLDRGSFERGEELLLDTPVMSPSGGRVDGRSIAPCAVEFRLPQRRAEYEALWFCQPATSFVAAARSEAGGSDLAKEISDRDLSTGSGFLAGKGGEEWALDLDLTPGRRYRSLVIVAKEERPVDLAFLAWTAGGRPVPVGRVRRWKRVTLVSLGDQEVTRVVIGPSARLGPLVALQEVWANPTRPDRRD
jgi:hypothetical protein